MHRAEPGSRRRPESTLLAPRDAPVQPPAPEFYRIGPGHIRVRLLPIPEPRRLLPWRIPWRDVFFLLLIAGAIVALVLHR